MSGLRPHRLRHADRADRALRPGRVRRGDDGITLAELIVSITIMSFIVSAITFALVVALKNSRANEDRLDAGGGAQLLAAFFPSDVASSSPDPAFPPSTDPDATTGCAEPDPGGNVVLLHLADLPTDTISYRLVTDGTLSQIVRVVCTGGTARRNTVAFNVSDTGSVQADVQRSAITGMVVGVSLSAVVGRNDAVPLAVSGVVRARSDDRDAPLPCTVATATPYGLVVDAAGRVLADMVFDLYMVGTCGQISLQLPTGGPGGVVTIAGRNSVEFWEMPVGPSTGTFVPTPGTTTRTATT